MNRKIPLLATLFVVALVGCKRKTAEHETFVVEVMNRYTPVKNQGRGETCWIYAMLSTIETEHIGRGDSVHLSPYYVVRRLLENKAQKSYFAQGRQRISMRGMGMMAINAIEQYGVVPYDAYSYGTDANVTVVVNKLRRVAAMRTGLSECLSRANAVLDESLGPVPPCVFMLGAEYTPQEFARSVCAPDEYEALTSFTHHPFGSGFVLEVPDNHDHDIYNNVALDSLLLRVEQAVRHGHGVCWEGDTSEPGFSFANGVARLPLSTRVSQESRQRAFESFATTDDHCMAIVGIAHDSRGQKYFVMKNSWGKRNPYGGLMYVSFDYFRMKTVAVFLPREQ